MNGTPEGVTSRLALWPEGIGLSYRGFCEGESRAGLHGSDRIGLASEAVLDIFSSADEKIRLDCHHSIDIGAVSPTPLSEFAFNFFAPEYPGSGCGICRALPLPHRLSVRWRPARSGVIGDLLSWLFCLPQSSSGKLSLPFSGTPGLRSLRNLPDLFGGLHQLDPIQRKPFAQFVGCSASF